MDPGNPGNPGNPFIYLNNEYWRVFTYMIIYILITFNRNQLDIIVYLLFIYLLLFFNR